MLIILVLEPIIFHSLFLGLRDICGYRSTRKIFLHLVHFPGWRNSNRWLNSPFIFELCRTLPHCLLILWWLWSQICYFDILTVNNRLILLIGPLLIPFIFLLGPNLISELFKLLQSATMVYVHRPLLFITFIFTFGPRARSWLRLFG